jgi:hypothetical protein
MIKRAAVAEARQDLATAGRLKARAVQLEKGAHGMLDEAAVLKAAASRLLTFAALTRKPPKRH